MVDLIIPTWKARNTLPAALDSLVAQTKKLFIVTIVQDADGEDYSDIIEEYHRRGLKIRLIQMEQNGGPGLARQRGMDTDTMSKYFMFMDSDDILNPRAIEVLTREIELNNADMIFSNFLVDKPGVPAMVMDVDSTPCTWTHGKVYRAEYLRKNNIRFHPELRLNEDSYFNLVATNCTTNKIKIHEVTYIWHQTPTSLTRKDGEVGFFTRGWAQYITSQVYGLQDIGARLGQLDPNLAAATFINMYTQHMKAMCNQIAEKCSVEDFNSVARKLGTLKNDKVIMEAVRTKQFWEYISKNLKGCEMFDDHLIFYKMRFCDWMQAYITEELV